MDKQIKIQVKGRTKYDLATRRAALHPQASLQEKVVRSIRASASGQTLPEYEDRLRSMGVQF